MVTSFSPNEHDANAVYTTPTLADYEARDEEGGVTWMLSGTDSGDFVIDGDGLVTFANAPSFEEPADFDEDNVYEFTVVATDVMSTAPRLSAMEQITVTVLDIEEAGTITVDNLNPVMGADCDRTNPSDPGDGCVIFRLTDPDGSISLDGTESWDLQVRTVGGTAGWESAGWGLFQDEQFIYKPNELHVRQELRALVSYTDRRGPGKSAQSEGTAPIAENPLANVPPRFHNSAYASILEGPAGRLLPFGLQGRDRDGDTLTYGVVAGMGDADFFEVNTASGQITLLPEVDFETEGRLGVPLTFTATLHDGKGLDPDDNTIVIEDESVDVTILMSVTIGDAEEEGVVTLNDYEPSVGATVEATLVDGDGRARDHEWRWARSPDGSTNWNHLPGPRH